MVSVIASSTLRDAHCSYISGQMLSLGNAMFLLELITCRHLTVQQNNSDSIVKFGAGALYFHSIITNVAFWFAQY